MILLVRMFLIRKMSAFIMCCYIAIQKYIFVLLLLLHCTSVANLLQQQVMHKFLRLTS